MDDERIADLVVERLKNQCPGACGLSSEARNEMGHVLGVVKDQGDGDYAKGAEKLRSVMKFFGTIDTASTWVARSVILFVVIGILKLISKVAGIGFLDWFKKLIN